VRTGLQRWVRPVLTADAIVQWLSEFVTAGIRVRTEVTNLGRKPQFEVGDYTPAAAFDLPLMVRRSQPAVRVEPRAGRKRPQAHWRRLAPTSPGRTSVASTRCRRGDQSRRCAVVLHRNANLECVEAGRTAVSILAADRTQRFSLHGAHSTGLRCIPRVSIRDVVHPMGQRVQPRRK
jgi:hypothetical protein